MAAWVTAPVKIYVSKYMHHFDKKCNKIHVTMYHFDKCYEENKGISALRLIYEPHHEKTGFLPMRKKRRKGNYKVDQRLCFHYTERTTHLLLKSKSSMLLVIFCNCTDWFMSDLIGKPEDQFSHVTAHI